MNVIHFLFISRENITNYLTCEKGLGFLEIELKMGALMGSCYSDSKRGEEIYLSKASQRAKGGWSLNAGS